MNEEKSQICGACGSSKPLSEFYFHKSRQSYMSACKSCILLASKKRHVANPGPGRQRAKQYREENREKWLAVKKQYREANKEKVSATKKRCSSTDEARARRRENYRKRQVGGNNAIVREKVCEK